jgi:DNA-binding NarL/FixJ family response regulator
MDAHAPRPITESRIADVLAAQPEARLVVAAEKFSEAEALSLLRLGVRGLLTYAEARTRLPEAVRAVAGGGFWVPRAWLGRFVDSVLGKRGANSLPAGRVAGARARMSKREQQVLDALLENLANKEIAVRLNISERTVKFHVSNLLAKFGVRRRADLILLSFQAGAKA